MEPVRVLVVDDDVSFCEMMEAHLRRKDFLVESAMDGMEAIQILRTSGPFCVMVTDLMMPGMSGLELLRRARKLDPMIEVIVITAADSIEMAISSLREDGAYDYLTKPLEMIGELSLAVDRAAKHRQILLEREALKESLVNGALRLKEILSSIGIPILAGDDKDELITISPAAESLMGGEQEGEGKKKDQLPESVRDFIERWRALGTNQVAYVITQWPDGEEKLVKITPMPMGVSFGWVMEIQDITYMKRLERFIVDSYARVATTVGKPMEKASIVIIDLEEKLRAGEDGLPHIAEIRRLFDEAQKGTSELLTLNSNGSEICEGSERISLSTFLEKNRTLYEKVLKERTGGGILWDFAEELPDIELDKSLLSQLFHHLMQHAKLGTEEQNKIEVKSWTAGDRVWLSVMDSKLANQDISTMYSMSDGQETHQVHFNQGQMELAVVKSLAEQMGCQVWMHQGEGGGFAIAICF